MKKLFLLLSLCVFTETTNAQNQSYLQLQKMKTLKDAQSLFRKNLQRKCGYTAGYWAQQHTLMEWKIISKNDTFKKEFALMCPRGVNILQDEWIEPLYLFAKEYAQDTGNKPRC